MDICGTLGITNSSVWILLLVAVLFWWVWGFFGD